MKNLITFLVSMLMVAFTTKATVYTMTSNPTSYCENTQITLKFYVTGGPSTNAIYGGSSSYRVYINSVVPFTGGIAVGSAYNPDSLAGGIHYLKTFSASNPGTITVTIPSGYVGSPKIGVTLINGTGGTPMGSNAPVPAITVYPATIATPTITVIGGQQICSGSSVTLSSSQAYSYSWSPGGATTSSIVVSPTVLTTYSLDVTNPCGGNASATETINVISTPTASINPNSNQTICQGGNVQLTASGGNYFSWSDGSGSQSITVYSAGSYYAVVSNGCQSEDDTTITISVTVNPNPTISTSPSSSAICAGSQQTLSASGGAIYVWSTGQTASSIVVSPTSSTNYNVTGTDGNGCSNMNSAYVSVTQMPVANAGQDVTIQSGNSTTIGGVSSGTSYSWSTGATTQQIAVAPTATTSYILVASNQCGSDTDTVTVVVTSNPTGIFNASGTDLQINIYPNPTSDELSIDMPEGFYGTEASIFVYDVLGGIVLSKKIDNISTVKLDVSQLDSGTYVVVIRSDLNHSSSRFIKTK